VDPRALLGYLVREERAAVDPASGRVIAGHFGAGLYILGDVLGLGTQVRIDAALYDRDRADEAVAEGTVEGEAVRLSRMVNQLAVQLLGGKLQDAGDRLARLASATTDSLEALKAYLQGESSLRRRAWRRALEEFQRAVAVDTSFALGYYRLSWAAAFNPPEVELMNHAAAQAVRYKDRLSEVDARLVDAFWAFVRGAGAEADRLYRMRVRSHPDDVEAWYMLAENVIHHGPRMGLPIMESRAAFEQVLRLEPDDYGATLIHLTHNAAGEGKHEEIAAL
ncbi:MAG: hypothetical protein GTN62_05205, partial [Gemmatimonadales bacterium]|nr:hypothetical protein [Gemmatimonadales bacterium]NIP06959.1 hypothetical protein [Gemmatimonadales bacterium]